MSRFIDVDKRYSGCLLLTEFKNKYYWLIGEDVLADVEEWEEIPESLYRELIKFRNKNSTNIASKKFNIKFKN